MLKDKAQPYISESEIRDICKRLGRQIEAEYRGKELIVLCVLKGSVLFTADLIRQIDIPMKIDFIKVSSYGNGTTSSGTVTIHKDITLDISSKHVLVVEDILDTGHTLTFLKNHLLGSKPESIKLCAFLDKPSRRTVPIKADFVGKAIEDKFVIGYGLDYDERGRNYPEVLHL